MNEQYEQLRKDLQEGEIIAIMHRLGSTEFQDKGSYLLFRTVCHNEDEGGAGYNLAYYKDSKLFHCFSECGETFNIYSLIKKRFILLGNPDIYMDNLYYFILGITKRDSGVKTGFIKTEAYIEYNLLNKYEKKNIEVHLPTYKKNVLNSFEDRYTPEWLNDGISIDAMKQYNIKYSFTRNSIIIPHYNIDNELIGIRERPLDKEREKYGKYRPIISEGTVYKHPLGLNLYGLNIVKNNIKKNGLAIIAEGEKSAMQARTFLGEENNVVVASCGSVINRWQILLLMQHCNPKEIIIAFDKEEDTDDKYFKKLYKMCQKYNTLTNFSFLYDFNNIMKLKDSPFDNGKEVFDKLIKTRVKVGIIKQCK